MTGIVFIVKKITLAMARSRRFWNDTVGERLVGWGKFSQVITGVRFQEREHEKKTYHNQGGQQTGKLPQDYKHTYIHSYVTDTGG